MQRSISAETWGQTKTAYGSGICLREIARNMGIPAGTGEILDSARNLERSDYRAGAKPK